MIALKSLLLQGELEVVKEVHKKHIMEKTEDGDELNGGASSVVGTDGMVTETSKVPFLMLGLDLPPPPLFKDAMEKNIIPQVCLAQVPMYYYWSIISCGCFMICVLHCY
jgi:U4/U6.U5 tri-snRNP-associated protein 2